MDTAQTQFFAARTMDEDEEDLLSESGRAIARMMRSDSVDIRAAVDLGLTESEHDDLMRTLQEEDNAALAAATQQSSSSANATSSARPIPVPSSLALPIHRHAQQQQQQQNQQQQQPQSQASSHGSSGSAFLSSVLNPTASTFNQTQLSHTPPMASSYEVSHFGKRARSGSVSGRLRSASEYLEERGLLDRHTKGLLKDLIIIGDEELQQAIDAYETGDPSKLEEMINSGALQNRLPADIDILGDLDLDFLTVNDDIVVAAATEGGNIESLRHDNQAPDPMLSAVPETANNSSNIKYSAPPAAAAAMQSHNDTPNMVSPQYNHDDGIGDLEFAGDLVTDQAEYLQLQPQAYGQQDPTIAASPGNEANLSDLEQRMRSNSLFSALLNDPRAQPERVASFHPPAAAAASSTSEVRHQQQQYGKWMDRNATMTNVAASRNKNATTKPPRRASAPNIARSGLSLSLDEAAERKRLEKQAKKEKREKAKQEKKERKEREKQQRLLEQQQDEDAEKVHIPGSGRPRSLSDPNLRATLDRHGLQQVERPDGWVGAYSPESRRVRIERFMEKRNHRVWTKTVKYDVRKNFADSRLRVKGRFVKKEDEVLMRELMSLT